MTEGKGLRTVARVSQPFVRVRDAMLRDSRGMFSRATMQASERASDLVGHLHAQFAGLELEKQVHIEFLGSSDTRYDVEGLPSETCIELAWTALGRAALFPTMRAELVLRALSADETQLEFMGHYQTPLGPVGAVIDAVIGHRLAEACVQQFVVDVAQQVTSELES